MISGRLVLSHSSKHRRTGTIEPGKLAELTFLGSHPLIDIRNTRDVRRVMRAGRLFTVADLAKR
jgi:imidazolonepropionase-like amidohydrolase